MTYVKDLDNGTTNGTNNTTIIATLEATASAGNTVVAIVGCASTQTINSVADSRGNTWTLARRGTNSVNAPLESVAIYFTLQNIAPLQSGDTVTATLSANNAIKMMMVQEFEGQLILDATGIRAAAASANISVTASSSTTLPDTVAIAAFTIGTAQASWTKDAAYSVATVNLVQFTAQRTLLSEYRVLTQTGTETATGTITSTTQMGAIATFYVMNPRYPAINHQNPGIL